MAQDVLRREILHTSKDFKKFWKASGPFRYALTSNEFPPVLLEPEEWIFSDDMTALLKSLMEFEKRKMKIVKAPFNPDNKAILRPDNLGEWKISHFPEEWNASVCDAFVPEGHLTRTALDGIKAGVGEPGPVEVESAFFHALENCIEELGYLLFRPGRNPNAAAVGTYLTEWETDEQDAGFL